MKLIYHSGRKKILCNRCFNLLNNYINMLYFIIPYLIKIVTTAHRIPISFKFQIDATKSFIIVLTEKRIYILLQVIFLMAPTVRLKFKHDSVKSN